MINRKIILFAFMAACMAAFSACSPADKGASNTVTAPWVSTPDVSAEKTSEPAVQTEPVLPETETNDVDPAVKFDLSAGVTDKMYGRALLNEGDLSRLGAAMKKAQSGEDVTVAVIGGSITQGSLASGYERCYASLFFNWWQEKFPDCAVNTVNAGIGGTDSYLGVHRADSQLLSHEPDVVIVEFSVNDTDKVMNKYSYDSLVRKILSADNSPAVILLFTTQENGTSLQDVHKEIGEAYELPMISYREAIYPEVAAGTIIWKDISPDNIHPNDVGHSIIGQLLSRYLDGVYDRLDSIDTDNTVFDKESFTADFYKNARICGSSEIEPVFAEGFEVSGNSLYQQFPDNWKTDGGGTIAFEAECRNMGILILRTTDGKSGTYEVYVDGEKKGKLEGDFSGGWGSCAQPVQVLLSKETAPHTVEIKPAEGSEEKKLTILALMLS